MNLLSLTTLPAHALRHDDPSSGASPQGEPAERMLAVAIFSFTLASAIGLFLLH